ncbi:MAG: DUF2892 domain-containing protein [Acidimicrobiia bacterium]|nr:DUF2892 domain-containing protein [Acidimicrobiia bacterium]
MKYINEATWDRALRVGVGLVLLALGWGEIVSGGLGTFFKVFGLVPLATGLVGWCPLYAIFGFRTSELPRELASAT